MGQHKTQNGGRVPLSPSYTSGYSFGCALVSGNFLSPRAHVSYRLFEVSDCCNIRLLAAKIRKVNILRESLP